MNPSQESTQSSPPNMDSQPMDTSQNTVEKQSEVDKEREMAELLMAMDNYKSIVRHTFSFHFSSKLFIHMFY